ncbi:hypothetical protein PF004_g7855 [Phytophthora fragariae]|uniref:Uncharacterized protein n=1 Tax=Phytophthora fragariae TaxID=53985 RepID=A0A6G0P8G5_9STRA|nr:hypothetical protein PF004_g7855 [Phytophthora fragariae]
MSSTCESGGSSAGPSAYHVMEQDLKPWDLYSLDGPEQPECLNVMKEYFTRYRMIRGKKTNNTYTHYALQCSWCAFIRRWNAAGREGLSFTSWLEDREAAHSTRSIGDLRTRVCEMAQREWHLCYGHLVEGCTRCQDRPRPTREEWERQVMNWALSEDEVAGSGATTGLSEILKLQQVVAAGVVRRASGLARAVSLKVQVTCGGVAAARTRLRERGLVVAHEIGDVFKKAATGLPRILCRRVSKLAHPIVLLGGLSSSGARIRSTRGTVRGTLAVGASIVINQALHDVSLRPRCIHKRREPITLVPSLLQRRLAPSGPTSRST